jgi:hypothetical protein
MPIPQPNKGEKQNDFVGRCMDAIGSEYDSNEQAVAVCVSTYDKANKSKDTMSRVQLRVNGIRMIELASFTDEILSKVKLAEEGGGNYPWEDCIADAEARYGDEETAKKVCGAIKAENS